MKDLIVLVADKDALELLQKLLARVPTTSQIKSFKFDIESHPQRDGGVRTDAANWLRKNITTHTNVLVIFDHEGSGEHKLDAQSLETKIESELIANGWQQANVCVCIIDPELENWVWVANNSLKNALDLDWQEEKDIRNWLETEAKEPKTETHFVIDSQTQKPTRPKEAFEAVLKHCKERFSSALFADIGKNASYQNCQDRAFLKMLNQLKIWFS